MSSQAEATAARLRYQRRAAVAAMLGITPDRLAHEMGRHPGGIPEPDAEAEGRSGKTEPLWLPRLAEWQAWRASFPGRTGRPRKTEPTGHGSSRSHHDRLPAGSPEREAQRQPGLFRVGTQSR